MGSHDICLTMSAPLDVELDVTGKCQLDCTYCSAAPLMGAEIATEKAVSLIKNMGELGVFSLLVSGGEPTIHPGIVDIMRCASQNIPSITMNTNGIRLANISFAKRMHDAAPNAMFSISLDAVDAEVNNIHRGSGGAQAKTAIHNCLSLGQLVNISCVLTEDNIDATYSILDSYSDSVRRFSFFPRVPRSKDEISSANRAKLFWEKFNRFIEHVNAKYPPGGEIYVMLPFKRIQTDKRGGLFDYVEGCCCAYTRLYIDSALNVYPCYYSAGPENLLGSCNNSILSEVWSGTSAGRLRERASRECLCKVSFLSDEVPYRFSNSEHVSRMSKHEQLRSEAGEGWRALVWKNNSEANK